MIEKSDLIYFKDQHPGHQILYITMFGREFVFRTITRNEYKNIIMLAENEYEIEDLICQIACLYPDNYNFGDTPLAGIPKYISPIISEESGFGSSKTLISMIKQSNQSLQSTDTILTLIVKAAFPEYSLPMIEDWSFEKLLDMAFKANYILNLKGIKTQLDVCIQSILASFEQKEEDPHDKKIIETLRLNNIDPASYFKSKIFPKNEYVEVPIIMGDKWNDEVILHEISKQMAKAKNK